MADLASFAMSAAEQRIALGMISMMEDLPDIDYEGLAKLVGFKQARDSKGVLKKLFVKARARIQAQAPVAASATGMDVDQESVDELADTESAAPFTRKNSKSAVPDSGKTIKKGIARAVPKSGLSKVTTPKLVAERGSGLKIFFKQKARLDKSESNNGEDTKTDNDSVSRRAVSSFASNAGNNSNANSGQSPEDVPMRSIESDEVVEEDTPAKKQPPKRTTRNKRTAEVDSAIDSDINTVKMPPSKRVSRANKTTDVETTMDVNQDDELAAAEDPPVMRATRGNKIAEPEHAIDSGGFIDMLPPTRRYSRVKKTAAEIEKAMQIQDEVDQAIARNQPPIQRNTRGKKRVEPSPAMDVDELAEEVAPAILPPAKRFSSRTNARANARANAQADIFAEEDAELQAAIAASLAMPEAPFTRSSARNTENATVEPDAGVVGAFAEPGTHRRGMTATRHRAVSPPRFAPQVPANRYSTRNRNLSTRATMGDFLDVSFEPKATVRGLTATRQRDASPPVNPPNRPKKADLKGKARAIDLTNDDEEEDDPIAETRAQVLARHRASLARGKTVSKGKAVAANLQSDNDDDEELTAPNESGISEMEDLSLVSQYKSDHPGNSSVAPGMINAGQSPPPEGETIDEYFARTRGMTLENWMIWKRNNPYAEIESDGRRAVTPGNRGDP